VDIARELGLGGRFNMLMQAAFFKLTAIIDPQTAADYLKQAVEKSYGSKGASVIEMNQRAIELGMAALHRVTVPAHWATLEAPAPQASALMPDFIRDILQPMNRQRGDLLPVSAFAGMEDGTFPSGTAAWEKRGIALEVPVWQPDGCTQCNQCAFVCPHAAIRPALLSAEEQDTAPAGLLSKPAQGAKDYHYHLAISPLDCSGCGNCVESCPSRGKALQMVSLDSQRAMAPVWDYALGLAPKDNPFRKTTVKGSQFETPLLEFSGACAGCGETPYARLITQLFGDRMLIANATGCSSIWGASAPSMPYTTNHRGHGPAWANSLFEDNAEFGLGMMLGGQAIRQQIAEELTAALALPVSDALHAAMRQWLAQQDEGRGPASARTASVRCWRRKKRASRCWSSSGRTATISSGVRSGSSAATAGPTISALAASIMCWPVGKTSIFWCLIPRSTPTPAASRPNRPRWRRSPNLPLRETHAKKISA
jgi:pyruvate-ferredoxin/flavodoxin oxidoreductase